MSIVVADGFKITTNKAVDDRFRYADTTARDALNVLERYTGLITYVESEDKFYTLRTGVTNADWEEFKGGSGGAGGPWVSNTNTGRFMIDPSLGTNVILLSNGSVPVVISGINSTGLEDGQTVRLFNLTGMALKIENGGETLDENSVFFPLLNDGLTIPDASMAELQFNIDPAFIGWYAVSTSPSSQFMNNMFMLGRQDGEDVLFSFNAGGAGGVLKYNFLEEKFQYSNDNGTTFLDFGTGGGGGANILFQDDFETSKLTDYFVTDALSLSGPTLHGLKAATMGHDTVSTYSFSRVYSVDAKFRGKNMTIMSDILSSCGTSGLVTLKVHDVTNTVELLNESLTYDGTDVTQNMFAFDIPSDCFDVMYEFIFLPDVTGGVTTIDDVVCALTSSLTTETALVQEEDFLLRCAGNSGTAVTVSVTDIPFTALLSQGNPAGTWNGSSFIVLESGNLSFVGSVYFTAAGSRNISIFVGGVLYKYASSYTTSAAHKFQFEGYFAAGQVISFRAEGTGGTLSNSTPYHYLEITKDGKLRQVNVNSNQKMKIPTSKIIASGTSKGTGYSSLAMIQNASTVKGSDIEVVTTAVSTKFIFKKAGWASVGAVSVCSNSHTAWVYLNGAQKDAHGDGTASINVNIGWTGEVAAYDYIEFLSNGTQTSFTSEVQFFATEVQVSVSNTLPQFAETDLVVKAAGNAGQALTANVTNIPFTTISDTTGGAWNGSQFTIPSDGSYGVSGSVFFVVAASRRIEMYVGGTLYKVVSNTAVSTSSFIKFDLEETFTAGTVISFRTDTAGTLLNNTVYHYLNITKVGKPNVTGVEVTPFVNIPYPTEQFAEKIDSTAIGNTDLTGALTTTSGVTDIFSYDVTTGVYTFLKKASVVMTAALTASNATAVQAQITRSGVQVGVGGSNTSGLGWSGTAAFSGTVNIGQTLKVRNTGSGTTSAVAVTLKAVAMPSNIITPIESFSTDTATLAWSSSLTLATLSSATVGSYITGKYTAGGSSFSYCTTRPTQTDLDMSANGMRIYGRARSATSTDALPAFFAIQIGKGLQSCEVFGFSSTAKATALDTMYFSPTTTVDVGVQRSYNPITGVLTLDAGYAINATTTRYVGYTATSGYPTDCWLTVQASKSPALAGVPLIVPKVATLRCEFTSSSNGQTSSSSFIARYMNVLEDPQGIVLNPSAFTGVSGTNTSIVLGTGTYRISGYGIGYTTSASVPQIHTKVRLHNITDGVTTVYGGSLYNVYNNAQNTGITVAAPIHGTFTISGTKTFEFQQAMTLAIAAGMGAGIGFGGNEVFGALEIQKLK